MNDAAYMTRPKRPGVGLAAQADEFAPWFHNLHLPDGSQTAPDHPLGDFPAFKWRDIAPHIPEDLTGWSALDLGCNAGFYTIELAKRGARVTGIDVDPHFLQQARWALRQFGLGDRVELRQAQVYDVMHHAATYDLVLFLGVFYHLRYPQLALDLVAQRVGKKLIFQTLTMPGQVVVDTPRDLAMDDRDRMLEPGWPAMAYIEQSLAGDATNWWAPNHACVEAMLRSAGLTVTARPAHEIYVCEPAAGSATWDLDELRAATGGAAQAMGTPPTPG